MAAKQLVTARGCTLSPSATVPMSKEKKAAALVVMEAPKTYILNQPWTGLFGRDVGALEVIVRYENERRTGETFEDWFMRKAAPVLRERGTRFDAANVKPYIWDIVFEGFTLREIAQSIRSAADSERAAKEEAERDRRAAMAVHRAFTVLEAPKTYAEVR